MNVKEYICTKLVEKGLDEELANSISLYIDGPNLRLPFVGTTYLRGLQPIGILLGLVYKEINPVDLGLADYTQNGKFYCHTTRIKFLGQAMSQDKIRKLIKRKYKLKEIEDLKVAAL